MNASMKAFPGPQRSGDTSSPLGQTGKALGASGNKQYGRRVDNAPQRTQDKNSSPSEVWNSFLAHGR